MQSHIAVPFGTLLAFGALCPALGASRNTEVNVVVDFTPEGRKIAHPAPGKPAYYYPVMGGFEELGEGEAGEKPPRQWDVAHVVALELARQGYLEMNPAPRVNQLGEVTFRDGTVVTVPAHPVRGRPLEINAAGDIPLTRAMLAAPDGPYSLKAARSAPASAAEGPLPVIHVLRTTDPVHGPVMTGMPDLILFIQLGYANPEIAYAPSMQMGRSHPSTSGVASNAVFGPPLSAFINQGEMLALVAGNTLRNLDRELELEVVENAEQDRYFIVLGAYDFEAYRNSRKLVLLWQAKMSAPSDPLAQFSDVLTALVWAGGPYFGRETTRPKTFILPVTPEGRVEVGTPQAKDFSETPPPAQPASAPASK
ncbi:MAG TPA: hypothetical protein VN775_01245 [Opitutaceae bacterium]|nr:hypothetical protein [Opitutaceae bacterium]